MAAQRRIDLARVHAARPVPACALVDSGLHELFGEAGAKAVCLMDLIIEYEFEHRERGAGIFDKTNPEGSGIRT
jgi:hypothetical protein